ncbi:MAG: hypothetical protein U1E60_25495 [Reyranellaceae bacterium]
MVDNVADETRRQQADCGPQASRCDTAEAEPILDGQAMVRQFAPHRPRRCLGADLGADLYADLGADSLDQGALLPSLREAREGQHDV